MICRALPVLVALCLLQLFPGRCAAQLETRSLRSEVLGEELKINVLLPDGYDAEKDRRYPVIYLLHGYGGDYREWERVGVVEEAKGLRVIIAMPEGDRSFYVNHHGNPHARWEDYITKEVVKFVDEGFRTQARREARGISGLSMGGYGAMVLGLRHPELFASVASHSGALGVPATPVRQGEIAERIAKIFGPEGSQEREAYSLHRIIEGLPADRRPDIYIDCGSGDFLLEPNRALVAELARLKVGYEYREVPGGHDFAYWKRNVRYSLSRQLEALERAAKAAAAKPQVAAAPAPAKPEAGHAEVLGDWDLAVEIEGNSIDYTLRFSEKEKRLAAILVSPRSGEHPVRKVDFKDGSLRVEIERTIEGNPVTFIYEGKLKDRVLSGHLHLEGRPEFKGSWSARRKSKTEEL